MNAIRCWITALMCCCLLASPLVAIAQVETDTPAAPQTTTSQTTTSQTATTIASARDADVPSLEELGLVPAIATVTDPPPTPTPAPSPTPSPSANDALSLQDLGFDSSQTQSNAALQAKLNKRTHMLKIHQKLGVITLAPMLATLFVAGGAKSHFNHNSTTPIITPPSDANVDLHIALGSLTAGLYGATAYYAIFAPKIKGTPTRGAIRVHKYLTFIHGPGMILTPILGEMALSQEEKGQKVHGIAAAHGDVAIVTALAYTAAIVSVSWPIHLKF
ncbi:MAG TPA: hypothetical protein VMU62_04155 [Acidobacteriaceae bacterium]|nr:hypothetical protein [Acidobacteriaceae bacterium]